MIGKYLLGGIAGMVSGVGPVIQGWFAESPAPAAVAAVAQPAPSAAPAAFSGAAHPVAAVDAVRIVPAAAGSSVRSAPSAPGFLVISGPSPFSAEARSARRLGKVAAERAVVVRCSVIRRGLRPIDSCDERAPTRG